MRSCEKVAISFESKRRRFLSRQQQKKRKNFGGDLINPNLEIIIFKSAKRYFVLAISMMESLAPVIHSQFVKILIIPSVPHS